MLHKPFEGKRILITGGTGSLGKVLVRRLLSGVNGKPESVTIMSRDEAKQHYMRQEYLQRAAATDEVIYQDSQRVLKFRIGDVRNFDSVCQALRGVDIVFNAAALKQVPSCEYFPNEAVQTNVQGAENIVRAIMEFHLPIEVVVGISTDKACRPINLMGMTKAIQERILLRANLECDWTRFVAVRYGNVLASRGSVVPLFLDQIRNGGPITITDPIMTRFLLSLDQAVDVVFAAVSWALPGELVIPRIQSARIVDLATVLIGDLPVETKVIGIRPGEKLHEILISDDEALRTYQRDEYFVVQSILPELQRPVPNNQLILTREFSSADTVMTPEVLREYLTRFRLLPNMIGSGELTSGELLR
ncbi:MAG: polysaccharide biosynthesis protein [Chloroflexi bacterium]|jgi:UDP-glucose 4-epimerase|uniref:polysaccharide biosynthesis protein n=1 Tax=Candidatus Flexifilum breve TaxID=3140694 RepID=UPI0031376663|nr:polysaccharide biosynthesis protein [Chloroflexota bacterium]